MSTTPIKIKKLKEAGALIYPATILDAIKDASARITVNEEEVENPHYGKSLRELLANSDVRIESLETKVGVPTSGEGEDAVAASGLFKAIEDLEAGEASKIANSKTIAEVTVGEGEEAVTSLETAVRIVYVDAVAGTPAVGDNPEAEDYVAAVPGVPAHIALVDKDGKELSTVDVSDLVANGFLKSSEYDSETGQLTLTFAQADGVDKDVEVNLAKMLDIDDVLISQDSQNYLDVALDGGEQSDAVFSVKIVKVAEAVAAKAAVGEEGDDDYQPAVEGNTGLADAADVKAYVDQNTADLAVSAEGDDVYVNAAVDADDNKKINVAAKIINIADATMGIEGRDEVGVEGEEGYQPAVMAQPKVTGLLDAADAKKYIDDSIESLSMVSLTAEAIDEVEYDDVF